MKNTFTILAKVHVVAFLLLAFCQSATAQVETMYVYKDGTVVFQSQVTEVDSIIFYQYSMLPNFNFADGLNGWTATDGVEHITVSTANFVSAGQSALFNGPSHTTMYSAKMDVQAGITYKIALQALVESAPNGGNIEVMFYDAAEVFLPAGGDHWSNWPGTGVAFQTVEITTTAPATAAIMQVKMWIEAGKTWVDNVVVTVAP